MIALISRLSAQYDFPLSSRFVHIDVYRGKHTRIHSDPPRRAHYCMIYMNESHLVLLKYLVLSATIIQHIRCRCCVWLWWVQCGWKSMYESTLERTRIPFILYIYIWGEWDCAFQSNNKKWQIVLQGSILYPIVYIYSPPTFEDTRN